MVIVAGVLFSVAQAQERKIKREQLPPTPSGHFA
jgi:hypothetical protein